MRKAFVYTSSGLRRCVRGRLFLEKYAEEEKTVGSFVWDALLRKAGSVAVDLAFPRSAFFALAYAANDVALIVLWAPPSGGG